MPVAFVFNSPERLSAHFARKTMKKPDAPAMQAVAGVLAAQGLFRAVRKGVAK